ncbi:MAG: hypothetical protein ACI4EU_06540 [Butyrivibrio sp.]
MRRLKCIASGLKRKTRIIKDDSGVAMIFVMIVGAVVLAFCLSMLLVTYTLFSQTSRQTTQMQCKLLAQTFSESFGEELKEPDSEICEYLGRQIKNGSWVSIEAPEDSTETDCVKELVLDLDDSDKIGDYALSVKLTYSVNVADDDEEETATEDDDQDDEQENGDSGNAGEEVTGNNAENKDLQVGNGTYCISALIKCSRGDASDRDFQYYTIETTYQEVTLITE